MKTSSAFATVFATAANALVPPLSSPTPNEINIAENHILGFSPRTTDAPSYTELRRRQGSVQDVLYIAPDNTCGFVSGFTSTRVTCAIGATCAAYYNSVIDYNVMGCCDEDSCGFRTTCYDYVDVHTSSLCNAACRSGSSVLLCTASARPYCQRQTVPGESMAMLICQSTRATPVRTLRTTYDGQGSVGDWTVLNSANASASFGIVALPPQSLVFNPIITNETPTTNTTSTTNSTTPPLFPTDPAPPPPSETEPTEPSTPVGAIVGGAVGGFAVLAGLIGYIVFFVLRRRKQASTSPSPAAGMVQHQSSPEFDPGRNSTAPSYFAPAPGAGINEVYDTKYRSPIMTTVHEGSGSGPSSPSRSPALVQEGQHSPPPPLFMAAFNSAPARQGESRYSAPPPPHPLHAATGEQVYYPPPVEREARAPTPTAELGVRSPVPQVGPDGRALYEAA